MAITIYHNPRCSKSRETLNLLTEKGIQPEIILYLDKQFELAEVQTLFHQLNLGSPREMMRTKDELYHTLQLDNPNLTHEDLFNAIVTHSALLERPIVVHGDKAKIGRPPESVLSIL